MGKETVKLTLKKFIVVPRDAMDVLAARHASIEEAFAAATDACAESGMSMYVIELRAVAARADRPVTVKKL